MSDEPTKSENSTNIVEFIPREQWEKTMQVEANKPDGKPLRKELNRRRVVSAVMDVYELMGGEMGMLEWAQESNENKTNFYKIWSRLLPSQAVELDDEAKKTYIGHVLTRTALDQ